MLFNLTALPTSPTEMFSFWLIVGVGVQRVNQLFSLLLAKRNCVILETGYLETFCSSTEHLVFHKGIVHFSLLHSDFVISS